MPTTSTLIATALLACSTMATAAPLNHRLLQGKASGPVAPVIAQATQEVCEGDTRGDRRCNHDSTHRVCARIGDPDTSFWKHTRQHNWCDAPTVNSCVKNVYSIYFVNAKLYGINMKIPMS